MVLSEALLEKKPHVSSQRLGVGLSQSTKSGPIPPDEEALMEQAHSLLI